MQSPKWRNERQNTHKRATKPIPEPKRHAKNSKQQSKQIVEARSTHRQKQKAWEVEMLKVPKVIEPQLKHNNKRKPKSIVIHKIIHIIR